MYSIQAELMRSGDWIDGGELTIDVLYNSDIEVKQLVRRITGQTHGSLMAPI